MVRLGLPAAGSPARYSNKAFRHPTDGMPAGASGQSRTTASPSAAPYRYSWSRPRQCSIGSGGVRDMGLKESPLTMSVERPRKDNQYDTYIDPGKNHWVRCLGAPCLCSRALSGDLGQLAFSSLCSGPFISWAVATSLSISFRTLERVI